MEYILQMAESLTTGLRHDSTTNQTANSGRMHRIEPSKVAEVTKVALRQLATGIFIIDISTYTAPPISSKKIKFIKCNKTFTF